MSISFYNGVSGMIAFQESMDQVSHNIANSGTAGYQTAHTSFRELLHTRMAVNGQEERIVGHGVRTGGADLRLRQGPVLQTGFDLDFALMGEGCFFGVKRADGSVEYTRNGAFDIQISGRRGYLVAADGSHVLDGKGREIRLERESDGGSFDLEGLEEEIGVFRFSNPYALEPSSGSCLRETGLSGEAQSVRRSRTGKEEDQPYRIVPGALEQSSVELADEMVNIIVAQRAFQMNAKMVQTADQVEEIVNNLR